MLGKVKNAVSLDSLWVTDLTKCDNGKIAGLNLKKSRKKLG